MKQNASYKSNYQFRTNTNGRTKYSTKTIITAKKDKTKIDSVANNIAFLTAATIYKTQQEWIEKFNDTKLVSKYILQVSKNKRVEGYIESYKTRNAPSGLLKEFTLNRRFINGILSPSFAPVDLVYKGTFDKKFPISGYIPEEPVLDCNYWNTMNIWFKFFPSIPMDLNNDDVLSTYVNLYIECEKYHQDNVLKDWIESYKKSCGTHMNKREIDYMYKHRDELKKEMQAQLDEELKIYCEPHWMDNIENLVRLTTGKSEWFKGSTLVPKFLYGLKKELSTEYDFVFDTFFNDISEGNLLDKDEILHRIGYTLLNLKSLYGNGNSLFAKKYSKKYSKESVHDDVIRYVTKTFQRKNITKRTKSNMINDLTSLIHNKHDVDVFNQSLRNYSEDGEDDSLITIVDISNVEVKKFISFLKNIVSPIDHSGLYLVNLNGQHILCMHESRKISQGNFDPEVIERFPEYFKKESNGKHQMHQYRLY